MIEKENCERIITLEAGYRAIDRNANRLIRRIESLLREEIIVSKITGAKEEEKKEWEEVNIILKRLKNIWDNQLELQCQITKEYGGNKKIPEEGKKDKNWEMYIQ